MVTFWHLLCHKPFLVATKKVSFAFVQVLWTFPNGSYGGLCQTMVDATQLDHLDVSTSTYSTGQASTLQAKHLLRQAPTPQAKESTSLAPHLLH